jgi:two-component system nitrate/nitrite response regulator NarL
MDSNITNEGLQGHPPIPKIMPLSIRTRKRAQPVPTVIVGKSPLFRAGLMHILAGGRFRVTAVCAALRELSEQAFGNGQSIALIGVDSDGGEMLEGITALKERHEGLRVIVLGDRLLPEQVFAAMAADADGYLLGNEISPDAVLKSLELVLVEGVVVPHGFTKFLRGGQARRQIQGTASEEGVLHIPPNDVHVQLSTDDSKPPISDVITPSCFIEKLSDRERLILMHLTKGASNKHIARDLSIAEATVKVHVKSLLRKIRVSNRTQAAMWAIKHLSPLSSNNS